MAEINKNSLAIWSISYAPDPQNPSKFVEVSRGLTLPVKITCCWCKSAYSRERENCPNCGGPHGES